MKRNILLVIAAITLVSTARAGVRIGPEFGFNFANLSSEGATLSRRTGMVIGGMMQVSLGDTIFVAPELVYVQKGAASTDTSLGITIDTTVVYDQLAIPLSVGTKIGGPGARILLFAGPDFGFAVTKKIRIAVAGSSAEGDYSGKSFEIGAHAGAGLELELGVAALLITGRYNLGITSINEASSSVKTNGIQLAAAALFGF